jgi:hypothetical protein
MNPVFRRTAVLLCALIVLVLQITPVTATFTLSGQSYLPNPPLVVGGHQQVTTTYYIGPSGATTFIPGHQLQMQTDLTIAQWNIQVIQNGRNAAQQTASGSVAFVNGALLSYPNNNDVSLSVTIDGVVPQTQGDHVMVVQVKEIDNSGNVVPGSEITINQPVAGQPAITTQTVLSTPAPTSIPPSPTTSEGFPVILGILAISVLVIIRYRKDR